MNGERDPRTPGALIRRGPKVMPRCWARSTSASAAKRKREREVDGEMNRRELNRDCPNGSASSGKKVTRSTKGMEDAVERRMPRDRRREISERAAGNENDWRVAMSKIKRLRIERMKERQSEAAGR